MKDIIDLCLLHKPYIHDHLHIELIIIPLAFTIRPRTIDNEGYYQCFFCTLIYVSSISRVYVIIYIFAAFVQFKQRTQHMSHLIHRTYFGRKSIDFYTPLFTYILYNRNEYLNPQHL